MLDPETLERFLLDSGYTEPSLVVMRPKYHRIIHRMHERGYDALNSDMAVTELDMILQQMRLPTVRNPEAEHHLRNVTGVRRGKTWKA